MYSSHLAPENCPKGSACSSLDEHECEVKHTQGFITMAVCIEPIPLVSHHLGVALLLLSFYRAIHCYRKTKCCVASILYQTAITTIGIVYCTVHSVLLYENSYQRHDRIQNLE